MTQWHFIEPLDVLILRGNRLFGAPGSYAESLMPPWPSVAAGALRSWLLAHEGADFEAYAGGRVPHPSLGTPQEPGSFTLAAFHLARRQGNIVEALYPPPADLAIEDTAEGLRATLLKPVDPAPGLLSSAALPCLPALAQDERGKPAGGYWLTAQGWERYLRAEPVPAEDLLPAPSLYTHDLRVGVALDAATRSVRQGALFSTASVALKSGVGFLACAAGAQLPACGMLRLGGDGRAAAVQAVSAPIAPEPDYEAIATAGRCRLVLTAPGVFDGGWMPAGARREGDALRFELHGVRGLITCAAVPRAGVVSGWDLARCLPKPAQRVAPTGSVYWLEELEASADALRKLSGSGLWQDPLENDPRRAEGFNRIAVAAW